MTARTRVRGLAWQLVAILVWMVCAACDSVDRSALPSPPDTNLEPSPDGRQDAGTPAPVLAPDAGCADSDSCSLPNAIATCEKDKCVVVECEGAYVDCDQSDATGCETTLLTVEHCGLCNATCALPNAITNCNTGVCRLERCKPGFANCDGAPDNGCETPITTTANCGACGVECGPIENGIPACVDGQCGAGHCLDPFGDCDGDRTDCETELTTMRHCGACEANCNPSQATGECLGGSCVVQACQGGFQDCNGLGDDGCEADLTSAAHCGACGATCNPLRATRALCKAGATNPSCGVDHGCPAGAGSCVEGSPANGCESGYADCDGLGSNGCETSLNTTNNCGACGTSCREPNTIMACEQSACVAVGCEYGFAQCAGDDRCRSLANDPSNCGTCGQVCPSERPNCYGGRCTSETCPAGRADCSDMGGCGTDLLDSAPESCGLCEVDCATRPNAIGRCDAGSCAIASCEPGFADCDGVIANGCETAITSPENCGKCGAVCALDGATAACVDGACEVGQCNPGRADCNGDPTDGCETNVALASSCGSCGLDCTAGAHVARGGCASGMCQLTCEPGYGDCDGQASNGCESDLLLETTCGGCGSDCTALPHVASARCGERGCEDLQCDRGYADCDGLTANGCERALNTQTDCGACDVPCAPVRGTGTCAQGACKLERCDSGFANCNGLDADGCEASLTSATSCGGCSIACETGFVCENGECKCTLDSQCPAGRQCCDGTCKDTNAVCSFWPCPVPGTARSSLFYCGGCEAYCPNVGQFFCCGPLLP